MIVFYDFHQEEPEVCTVMDFVYTHEEAYLVHWYANWRKWPAIYNSWRNVTSAACVPLPVVETHTSLFNRQCWIESEKPRKTVFSILDWHMYDTEKNVRKRAELVRSYFLNDPSLVVPVLMEKTRSTGNMKEFFSGTLELWMKTEMCVIRGKCMPN